MALQFPRNPVLNQVYDYAPFRYQWDGQAWLTVGRGADTISESIKAHEQAAGVHKAVDLDWSSPVGSQIMLNSQHTTAGNTAQIFHNGGASADGTANVMRRMYEHISSPHIWEKIRSGVIEYSAGATAGGPNTITFDIPNGTIATGTAITTNTVTANNVVLNNEWPASDSHAVNKKYADRRDAIWVMGAGGDREYWVRIARMPNGGLVSSGASMMAARIIGGTNFGSGYVGFGTITVSARGRGPSGAGDDAYVVFQGDGTSYPGVEVVIAKSSVADHIDVWIKTSIYPYPLCIERLYMIGNHGTWLYEVDSPAPSNIIKRVSATQVFSTPPIDAMIANEAIKELSEKVDRLEAELSSLKKDPE